MPATTTDRPTFIAPPGAVCGCCLASCAGEAATTFWAPGAERVYLHADVHRCIKLAFERWKQEDDERN